MTVNTYRKLTKVNILSIFGFINDEFFSYFSNPSEYCNYVIKQITLDNLGRTILILDDNKNHEYENSRQILYSELTQLLDPTIPCFSSPRFYNEDGFVNSLEYSNKDKCFYID